MRIRFLTLRFSRRLGLQYGLRSLLLATLAVCLALGWYVERVRRQQRAVAALRKAGADVVYYDSSEPQHYVDDIWNFASPPTAGEWFERSVPDWLRNALGTDFFRSADEVRGGGAALAHCCDLPDIRAVRLREVLDEDLANAAALAALWCLQIDDSFLSDVGIARIGEFHNLKCLEIKNRGSRLRRMRMNCERLPKAITDAGLARIANLRRLKDLRLENSAVTGAGLLHLAKMSDLEILDLSGTKVTDDGLTHLVGLRRLRTLDLSDTAVGDAGLKYLGKLGALEGLDLDGTLVTDRGLASLAALKRLRYLNLKGTAVTDEGLQILGDVTSLESLYIEETAATREGVATLNRRLPKLVVDFNEPRPSDVPLNRARVLMRGGLWPQALAALQQLDASYLEGIGGLSDVACCHAEMGHFDEAARLYSAALDQAGSTTSPFDVFYPHKVQWLWFELFELPPTFDRVARVREHDAERWLATARRAAIEGRWSDAVHDYRRVIEHSADPDRQTVDPEWFEYGLSQLLAGDMDESRLVRERLFDEDRRLVQMLPDGEVSEGSMLFGWVKRHWYAGTRLALVAPQSEVDVSLIDQWRKNVGASLWKTFDLVSLVYCREGKFEKVLEQEPPTVSNDEPHYVEGRFWFPRAMAHWHLGQLAQAHECYSKGVRWLDRNRKIAAIRGDYDAAGDFLEAEALRRESERLIIK